VDVSATNIKRDKMLLARSEAGLNLVSYCNDGNTNDTRDRQEDYCVDSRSWQANVQEIGEQAWDCEKHYPPAFSGDTEKGSVSRILLLGNGSRSELAEAVVFWGAVLLWSRE